MREQCRFPRACAELRWKRFSPCLLDEAHRAHRLLCPGLNQQCDSNWSYVVPRAYRDRHFFRRREFPGAPLRKEPLPSTPLGWCLLSSLRALVGPRRRTALCAVFMLWGAFV